MAGSMPPASAQATRTMSRRPRHSPADTSSNSGSRWRPSTLTTAPRSRRRARDRLSGSTSGSSTMTSRSTAIQRYGVLWSEDRTKSPYFEGDGAWPVNLHLARPVKYELVAGPQGAAVDPETGVLIVEHPQGAADREGDRPRPRRREARAHRRGELHDHHDGPAMRPRSGSVQGPSAPIRQAQRTPRQSRMYAWRAGCPGSSDQRRSSSSARRLPI